MNTEIVSGLRSLWKAVFNDSDAFLDAFFQIAYSPDRCRYHAQDGQILSALYWFDCQYAGRKLAYIYAVATDPAHRGKGLASQLLNETHSHLKAQGYSGAVLKPAEGLFPFYERLGYRTSCYVNRCVVETGTVAAQIKALSPSEYARLRRAYLPKNGITQEGVTLEFLHTFGQFYAAADALICIASDRSAIFEYLGNPDSAPGILRSLGIQQASLTTPGSKIPFAMYNPLDDAPAPCYLGITLE